MHEASHRSLFSNKKVNDWAGNWLCALSGVERPLPVPALSPPAPRAHRRADRPRPRPRHAVPDHAREPAPQDVARSLGPDRRRSSRWPRSSARSGAGTRTPRRAARRSASPRPTRCCSACSRSRAIPRSTCSGSAPGSPPTRSSRASARSPSTRSRRARPSRAASRAPRSRRWWERLLIAPNCVNYHMEHHLLITVPHYNLRAMHERLAELGVVDAGLRRSRLRRDPAPRRLEGRRRRQRARPPLRGPRRPHAAADPARSAVLTPRARSRPGSASADSRGMGRKSGIDKRRHQRHPRRIPCKLFVGQRDYTALVLDLSVSGLFIQTHARPRIGDAPAAPPDPHERAARALRPGRAREEGPAEPGRGGEGRDRRRGS